MPKAPDPPFLQASCPSCGWQTVIRQNSDVLVGPSECPECGEENLDYSQAGHAESLATHPLSYLESLLKRRG